MKSFKTLIAPIIIAALAVTGVSAAQAKADTSDVAKIIIGAVAVAAIADAIDNGGSKSNAYAVNSSNRTYAGRVVDNNYRYDRYRDHRDDGRRLRAASAQCLATYRSHNGARRLYESRCLTRKTHALGTPPRQCTVRVVMRGGKNRVAYDPRCLDRAGFWTPRQKRSDRYGDHRSGQYPGGQYQSDRRNGHIVYGN